MPGGLASSEFRGYEAWQAISIGRDENAVAWTPKKNEAFPTATVPEALANVDFMVTDSKRFVDSGGRGYAVFDYDAATVYGAR